MTAESRSHASHSMKFQDYYAELGVSRTATQDDIRRAYRKLARERHPDVDKTPGATERFQRLGEAYEVLKDPETRARYDQLGSAWKDGQDFTPPNGWTRREGAAPGDFGGFSEFFESFFGRGGSGAGGVEFEGFEPRARTRRRSAPRAIEAELPVPFATALRGGTRAFEIDTGEGARRIEVRVPANSAHGSVLRLRGQGGGGADLHVRLAIEPPPGFHAEGDDLRAELAVAPWQAALGGRVALAGPEGELVVTLPAGTSSGKTLRLRGQGLPRRGGGRGDLLAVVAIVVQAPRDERERALWEELAARAASQAKDGGPGSGSVDPAGAVGR